MSERTSPDPDAAAAIVRLLDIMARLRDPVSGCPWDLEQSFATIAPHTIEEAYEVADAIEREDLAELRGELGDLLFQVVFHSRLAEERGAFDFAAVADAIATKLVRRHPHVFGDRKIASVAEQSRLWEEIKREERAAAGAGERREPGVLDDVPRALPALSRAAKLGKRAAGVGFDWPDVAGVRAKVAEELGEVDDALAAAEREGRPARGDAHVAAELGDLVFAVANLCRHLDVDPESCVRGANARFERRFAHVEGEVRARGGNWGAFTAEQLDAFWRAAKAAERG
jgi:MazG family protein